jgi:dihydroflavonol-4-reductase
MILVTGATGFLGSQVAKQLAAQGAGLVCIKRKTSRIPAMLAPLNISWVDADVTDFFSLEDAFQNVTQVYHCAARVSFNPADKAQMLKTNISGTANIVNLCIEYNARLVHVSSIVAIGPSKLNSIITEENHLEETPATDGYAISKYESEMEVWRGVAEGLEAVVVNPSIIIGADAGNQGSGKIFYGIKKGLKFYTTGICGFVDVADVATCMIKLMQSSARSQRYIINAENISFKNLFAQTAHQLGVKPPSILVKPWMLNLVSGFSSVVAAVTGKPPALDPVSAKAAFQNNSYSNDKIRKAVDINFKPVDQTVSEICERMKSGESAVNSR